MTKSKRYYWLKLKEDFFNDVRMKRLRRYPAEKPTPSFILNYFTQLEK